MRGFDANYECGRLAGDRWP